MDNSVFHYDIAVVVETGAMLLRVWTIIDEFEKDFSWRCAQVTAILFGLIYLQTPYDQKGIMNLNGVIFLFQTQMSFGSLFAVVNVSRPFSCAGWFMKTSFYFASVLCRFSCSVDVSVGVSSFHAWTSQRDVPIGHLLLEQDASWGNYKSWSQMLSNTLVSLHQIFSFFFIEENLLHLIITVFSRPSVSKENSQSSFVILVNLSNFQKLHIKVKYFTVIVY